MRSSASVSPLAEAEITQDEVGLPLIRPARLPERGRRNAHTQRDGEVASRFIMHSERPNVRTIRTLK